MSLQTVRAMYRNGGLIFADPALTPGDGTEVIVTFQETARPAEAVPEMDPVQALRGRGKGDMLVERLLQSRATCYVGAQRSRVRAS